MKINSLLIEKANSAIKSVGIIKDGQYDNVFKGYISSFGASIAQAGLIPTIIFYEADSDAKERRKVVDALILLLDEEYHVESLAKELIAKRETMEGKTFKEEEKRLLKKVSEAMVAIKLALRLYKEKN